MSVTFLIRSSQPLIPCCRGMEVCPSLLEYIISMTHRLPTNSCQNIHFYFLQIFFYFHLIHQLCNKKDCLLIYNDIVHRICLELIFYINMSRNGHCFTRENILPTIRTLKYTFLCTVPVLCVF